jgi:hypothetical protein
MKSVKLKYISQYRLGIHLTPQFPKAVQISEISRQVRVTGKRQGKVVPCLFI